MRLTRHVMARIAVAAAVWLSWGTPLGVPVAVAQPGALDPTFTDHLPGTTQPCTGTTDAYNYATVLQPDGKIVTAGHTKYFGWDVFELLRHTPAGSLDVGFGNVGQVLTAVGNGGAFIRGLALQGNPSDPLHPKIVAAGYAVDSQGKQRFALARYHPDGTLDKTFGDPDPYTPQQRTGTVLTAIGDGGHAMAFAVEIKDSDPRILVAGQALDAGTYQLALARYSADGALDTTFGDLDAGAPLPQQRRGYALAAVGIRASAQALAFVDDDIVVAGSGIQNNVPGFALARFSASTGEPVLTFGSMGKVVTVMGTAAAYAQGVKAQVIGGETRIVVGGTAYDGGGAMFALARYLPNGTLDPSFGALATPGITLTSFGPGNVQGQAVSIRPSGIILAGMVHPSGERPQFALARYTLAAGQRDPAFGNAGYTLTPLSHSATAYALAAQPDGKLVLAGTAEGLDGFKTAALARYSEQGALDPAFNPGTAGIVFLPSLRNYTSISSNDVTLQADGKILVAGKATSGTYPSSSLRRHHRDGRIDPFFGLCGMDNVLFSSASGATAVAARPDGRIYSTGWSSAGIPTYRHPANGWFPLSFATVGSSTAQTAVDLVVQPDEKVIMVGNSYTQGSTEVLARFNPNGTFDATFGTNGMVWGEFLSGHSSTGVALQASPGGTPKIVVSSSRYEAGHVQFMVSRYESNGQHDLTFGDVDPADPSKRTGWTSLLIGSDVHSTGLAVQSDGRIVLGGYTEDAGQTKLAMARYLPDGTLDSSFGSAGIVKTQVGSAQSFAYALTLQGDRIVLVGSAKEAGTWKFLVARYLSDGQLDPAFGTAGLALTSVGDGGSASGVVIQDGHIVVVGSALDQGISKPALVRYLGQ